MNPVSTLRPPRAWHWLLGALALAALCAVLGLVFWASLPPAPTAALPHGLAAERQVAARSSGQRPVRHTHPMRHDGALAPTELRLGPVAWRDGAPAASEGLEPLQAFVQRTAMQALVVPVLDGDAQPARWSDPDITMPCLRGSSVTANGQPVSAGGRQPDAAYTLLWTMDGCLPFGPEGPVFTGRVEVDVFFDDDGPSAVVRPHGLQVTRGSQFAVLDQPFGARMP